MERTDGDEASVVLHDIQLLILNQIMQPSAEAVQREADHIVVVAFNRSHQQCTAALQSTELHRSKGNHLSVFRNGFEATEKGFGRNSPE